MNDCFKLKKVKLIFPSLVGECKEQSPEYPYIIVNVEDCDLLKELLKECKKKPKPPKPPKKGKKGKK